MAILNNKSILGLLLFILLQCSCLKEQPIKKPYTGYTPFENNDGWKISTPQDEQIDVGALETAYKLLHREDRFPMAQSLIVIRNGKIVAESYPLEKVGINTFSNIQSSTKSVTSILVGVAMQQGLLDGTDIKLVDLFPELFPDDAILKQITLHDALTMTSGLDFNNSAQTQQLYQEKNNSTAFVLNRKRLAAPGQRVHYSDGDPHLVSKAIETLYSKNLQAFADEHLFKKLGIKNYQWEQAKDGTTYGAFALHITARDKGKLGQLLLNNGQWNGEQIISPTYLQDATSHQVYIDLTGDSYGYYFWLYPEMNAYAANGHGGQYLFMAPDKNLIVVYTAWPYTNGDMQDYAMDLIKLIYDACY